MTRKPEPAAFGGMLSAILILLAALTGCADVSIQTRWQHAEQLANAAGWQKLRLPTESFVLSAYVPKSLTQVDILTVYVEGDGFTWVTGAQPSDDPTPRNPVALEMALRHAPGAAVYLARPCQYVAPGDARNCREAYWTERRFAPEVVASADQAIGALKQRFGARQLALIGYSGGGAVAALVAARRGDVVRLITVAGNLDHRAWTAQHRVPPLEGSLNPADEWRSLQAIPQLHFVGGQDSNVSAEVVNAYASRFPPQHRPAVRVIPDFGHTCCWVERWAELMRGIER